MYNEFNQHKKSDTIKWIVAFSLIIVLMAGVIASLVIAIGSKQPETPKETINAESQLDYQQKSGPILLAMGAPRYAAATASDTASVSYDVTATITPSTVENKKVDWEIEWSDDAALKDKPISDYLVVTPTSDGALTATLKCIKPFRGSSAILSATSRDSGVRGTANVTFSGKPATMTVNTSGIGTQSRGKLTGVFQLKRGQTYTQAITLSNVFNDVGSEYGNYTVTLTGVGSFVKGTFRTTATQEFWSEETTVTLDNSTNAGGSNSVGVIFIKTGGTTIENI